MAEYSIEISGENRVQLARELGEQLIAQKGEVQVYDETDRDVDPIAILSVVLTGIQTAGVIWTWWQSRRRSGTRVTIRTAGGQVIELSSDMDQQQLELLLTEER